MRVAAITAVYIVVCIVETNHAHANNVAIVCGTICFQMRVVFNIWRECLAFAKPCWATKCEGAMMMIAVL